VADRGFADQKFFRFLDEELKFQYIIRIKSNTLIMHKNTSKKSIEWVCKEGRSTQLLDSNITAQEYSVKQGQFYYEHFSYLTPNERLKLFEAF
jgi:hypothetical protein